MKPRPQHAMHNAQRSPSRQASGAFSAATAQDASMLSTLFLLLLSVVCLAALGVTAVGVVCLHEYCFHFASVRNAIIVASIAGGLGIVAGLWIPQRLIRKRLSRSQTDDHQFIAYDFASSFGGASLLVLGVIGSVLCAFVGNMESFRAFLSTSLGVPEWLKISLLHSPVVIGVFGFGLGSAVTLSALHGWERLLRTMRNTRVRVWQVVLFTVVVGMGIVSTVGSRRLGAVVGCVSLFAAGVVAVSRKCDGLVFDRRELGGEKVISAGRVALLNLVLAVVNVGIVFVTAFSPDERGLGSLAAIGAVCFLFAIIGAFVGKRVLRNTGDDTAIYLLVGIAAWVVPTGQAWQWWPALRLAWSIIWAVACVMSAGRLVNVGAGARAAWRNLGMLSVASGVAGVLLGGLSVSFGAVSAAAVLLVIVSILTVVVSLIVRESLSPHVRLVGTGLAFGLLILSVAVGFFHPGDENVKKQSWGYSWLVGNETVSQPIRGARVCKVGDLWRVDLTSRKQEAIVASVDDTDILLDFGTVRRLRRRIGNALLDGGRVVLEIPRTVDAKAIGQSWLIGVDRTDVEAYVLQVDGVAEKCQLLVIGSDIPAWSDGLVFPPDSRFVLIPVGSSRELTAKVP